MKLQTKLTVSLLASVVLVGLASGWFQHRRNAAILTREAERQLSIEESRQWTWIESLDRAVSLALQSAMERGDMEEYTRIVAQQREVRGLTELTLFNHLGVATYSTSPNRLKAAMPEELKAKASAATAPFRERKSDSFEICRPLHMARDCLQCHNEFKEGAWAGAVVFRFGDDFLKESRAGWDGVRASVQTSGRAAAGVGLAINAVLLGGVIAFVLRFQLARPLGRVIGDLDDGARCIHSTAESIASDSSALATHATDQAAAVEEVSASLEEMSSLSRRTADDTRSAREAAGQARESADRGAEQVKELQTAMESIQTASLEVTKILERIDEIAFQTNILALNAAVEAARVGAAGAGFAVVADEVRTLAQRCAAAARETSVKIEDAVQKSRRGGEITSVVSQAFEQIQARVRALDAKVVEIAKASEEQSLGVAEVARAVTSIDRVTQATAGSASVGAQTVTGLESQVAAMQQAVQSLEGLVFGNGGESTGSVGHPVAAPRAAASPSSLCSGGSAGEGAAEPTTPSRTPASSRNPRLAGGDPELGARSKSVETAASGTGPSSKDS